MIYQVCMAPSLQQTRIISCSVVEDSRGSRSNLLLATGRGHTQGIPNMKLQRFKNGFDVWSLKLIPKTAMIFCFFHLWHLGTFQNSHVKNLDQNWTNYIEGMESGVIIWKRVGQLPLVPIILCFVYCRVAIEETLT